MSSIIFKVIVKYKPYFQCLVAQGDQIIPKCGNIHVFAAVKKLKKMFS